LIRRSGFSRKHQSIVFISIWFRLDGELLFCQQRQKSNQKNAAPKRLPYGSPRHSPLPTGRPDSPSGLDRTKFDVPVEFSLPKANASANFTGRLSTPVKQRSLDGAQRNPGISGSVEKPRIPLRYIRATGMRSTSARDAFSFGYFSLGMQRQIHQE
jgi:hypothetical protein